MSPAGKAAIDYAEARTSARRLANQGESGRAVEAHDKARAIFMQAKTGAAFDDVVAVARALKDDINIAEADDALRAAGLKRE